MPDGNWKKDLRRIFRCESPKPSYINATNGMRMWNVCYESPCIDKQGGSERFTNNSTINFTNLRYDLNLIDQIQSNKDSTVFILLRAEIFASRNFREFRKFWPNSLKFMTQKVLLKPIQESLCLRNFSS